MSREGATEAIERKWISRWAREGLERGTRGKPGEPKFFIHFAYPGISGYLHVGHMRGFTYSDVFARFQRMTGHRVFFPAGFHASGIPSVGLARRVERGDSATIEYLKNNGCPPEVLARLKDPKEVVRYFSDVYTEDYWKRFGFLIDWRTLCTTIDPGYNRFIQWQFRRLKDRDLLVQKPHFAPFCPLDGAVAVDASETDIAKGGQAEAVEFTIVKFRHEDGTVLPCATLRPETTYGVTNLWLNPDATYVVAAVGSEKWLLSESAHEKLSGQRDGVGKILTTVTPVNQKEWVRKSAKNPLTGGSVPILPGAFVEPRRATGVVMSVPGHAPFDFQALREIRPEIKPIVIIRNPKAQGIPAEAACKKHGVKTQLDREALEAATEEVYADEFHAGEMLPNAGPLAGLKVSAAKEKAKELLYAKATPDTIQDFNAEVVCRCGRDVHIRKVPDQWFLRYSDAALTEESKRHAATMRIFPEEYRRDMPAVLDWFGDRACIRKGSWLGTEFPFKRDWIVEPISDSTLYPAFYLVSPYLASGELKPEDLTDAFFDYAFLGKGKPSKPVWKEVRADFEFWYPVDINLGGKEHKTVHFPPYVMNHVALFPPERRPRGIFVNWWVTQMAGVKISKSKGGAEPIPGAAAKYSVDGMRLYYANVASAHVDIEWNPATVLSHRAHTERVRRLVEDLLDETEAGSPEGLNAWLWAAWSRRLLKGRAAFEAFDLREATNELYYEFYNDLQWFRRRGGRRSKALGGVLEEWVRSLCPVTPFLAETLWERMHGKGLASSAAFPSASESDIDAAAVAQEAFVRSVLEDAQTIQHVAKISPKEIVLYTAPAWKRAVRDAVAAHRAKGHRDPGSIIKELMARGDLKPHAAMVPAFVQRLLKEPSLAPDRDGGVEELSVLRSAIPFLSGELGGARVSVFAADDPKAPDHGAKRNAAAPGKPAIFMA